MKKLPVPESPARIADVQSEFLKLEDPLSEHLRARIVELITTLADAQIDDVLGAERYARETRGGYRHGHRQRSITTSFGRADLLLPRARVFTSDGRTEEFQPEFLPRYQRRSAEVDRSILLDYLAGANTRRIEKALEPMLRGAPLSKSAVSRVVQQLKRSFDKWKTRSLAEHRLAYLFLDAIAVPVRAAGRSQQMAVLVALGVHETGERELLGLSLVTSESGPSWKSFIEDLSARELAAPALCVIDGHAGLRRAIATTWPSCAVQRCVVHKLRNLEARCPKHAWPDLLADFRAIVEAPSERAARAAYARFLRIWKLKCPEVVDCLLEAGEELLTFYRFPRAQWRALRTTNAIERLLEEFRRRIKTQGSLPSANSVLYLFYGIWASGQVQLRKIDGWRDALAIIAAKRSSGPSTSDAQAKTTQRGENEAGTLRPAA